MDNKSIVVVTNTYYPDSRATTYIAQQLLEHISKSYNIHVFCLNLFNKTFDEPFPCEHNGIHIYYAKSPIETKLFKGIFLRIKSKIAINYYHLKYKTKYQYDKLYIYSKQIEKLIKDVNAQTIISVSTPTDIHICTEMAIKNPKELDWIAISFDPHAYNSDYSKVLQEKFKKEEIILYEKAKRIFMLSQSKQDYSHSPLNDKIVFFEIPMEKFDVASTLKSPQNNDLNKSLKMMYIGNLYNKIRNPEYMFRLFKKISDLDFTLYIIGSFIGWGNELQKYQKGLFQEFSGKIEIVDRLSRQQSKEYMSNADFLVNIGNTTKNQCPSKVVEYISTGKPIIHFKKTDDCSSMQYLDKYPNVCVIDENISLDANALKLKTFISKNYGNVVSKDILGDLYKENDINYISEILISNIEAEN